MQYRQILGGDRNIRETSRGTGVGGPLGAGPTGWDYTVHSPRGNSVPPPFPFLLAVQNKGKPTVLALPPLGIGQLYGKYFGEPLISHAHICAGQGRLAEHLFPLLCFWTRIKMTEKVFTKAEDEIVRDLGMDVVRDAAAADASEHSMTLRQAFNTHRKAIFWSMALSGA